MRRSAFLSFEFERGFQAFVEDGADGYSHRCGDVEAFSVLAQFALVDLDAQSRFLWYIDGTIGLYVNGGNYPFPFFGHPAGGFVRIFKELSTLPGGEGVKINEQADAGRSRCGASI